MYVMRPQSSTAILLAARCFEMSHGARGTLFEGGAGCVVELSGSLCLTVFPLMIL